jgi:uncharacterized protein YjiS (DUF1127 family)
MKMLHDPRKTGRRAADKGWPLAGLRRLVRRLRLWHARTRQRRELAALSSYLLDDIGVTPAEAKRESAKRPWQAPALRSPFSTRR